MTDWKWMTGLEQKVTERTESAATAHPSDSIPTRRVSEGPPPRRLEVKESLSIGLESGMDMD